jgi:hypothetical protein
MGQGRQRGIKGILVRFNLLSPSLFPVF